MQPTDGGQPVSACRPDPAAHGDRPPRGQQRVRDDKRAGRFGAMFDLPACAPSNAAIDELVKRMRTASSGVSPDNLRIPAGFTYLGQFVDHDITFDPTPAQERVVDPGALENFRTPRFDLDSVYGTGPRDQPFLYDWEAAVGAGVKLLVGHGNCTGLCDGLPLAPDDLPRNQQGRALIGDPRNDEHVIISQLHLLLINFHNAVVDHLVRRGKTPDGRLFEEARRVVRWHYQWIVTHEFLCKIVGKTLANKVLEQNPPSGTAPAVNLEHFAFDGKPYIPVEFSGAAYRFGHSLVRDTYALQPPPPEPAKPPPGLTISGQLVGEQWLPSALVIHWGVFFKRAAPPGESVTPQPSKLIDAVIAPTLFTLPDGSALPRRNLERGRTLGLASGQSVARAMGEPRLDAAELELVGIDTPEVSDELRAATPLWYYILREAAVRGRGLRLGPVGGRIVAEVLVGLMQGDRSSYLHAPTAWRPDELLPKRSDFLMADLLAFVDDHRPA